MKSPILYLCEKFSAGIADFDDAAIVKPEEVPDDWRRSSDMGHMAGLINFLCYGIMNSESGKNFIETLGTNQMSAKEALEAFDKLLEIPGFSESIQEPVLMDDESLALVFLGS